MEDFEDFSDDTSSDSSETEEGDTASESTDMDDFSSFDSSSSDAFADALSQNSSSDGEDFSHAGVDYENEMDRQARMMAAHGHSEWQQYRDDHPIMNAAMGYDHQADEEWDHGQYLNAALDKGTSLVGAAESYILENHKSIDDYKRP